MNEKILKLLPGVEQNIPIAPYTTFKIGGAAKYFFIAKNTKDIITAVSVAKKCNIPFFILSGGSNLLISDKGFNGLVIKIENFTLKIKNLLAYADAGVLMKTLVRETGKQGLSGLEWAGGLPGSVGGAIRGNAGAFGGEIKDNVVSVLVLDEKGKTKVLLQKQCKFAYRDSLFKQKRLIVLSAIFSFKKGNKKTIQGIAKSHIQYRKEKHPLEYPNAGSVFKNCDFRKFSKKMQKELKNVVKVDPFPVVPVAYLISKAGLKGFSVGKAQVSTKHPNYIVNKGGASAKDILLLVEKVKKEIKKKFSITLEQEIQYIL